jgi:hypothetical protein
MNEGVPASPQAATLQRLRTLSWTECLVAAFVGAALGTGACAALEPFVDWSSDELRHLPPLRGQWEVIKSMIPFGVAAIAWLGAVLTLQRRKYW